MRSDLGGDVKINSVRYVLHKDKERGKAWWKEGGLDLQEGEAKKPVAAVWPRGWRGGMGETKRVAPESYGYAFSENIDCTPDGYARLAARRIAVTPTNAPTDAKTYFFPDSPSGSAVYSVGSFTKSTSVGTTTQSGISHGLSVTPKAFIFWTAGKTASGTVGAGDRNCIGISDLTRERAWSWNSEDNKDTMNAAKRYGNKAIILVDASGGTSVPEATTTNVGASTFDLSWTNNDATADIIHFLAIGGSDIQAYVKESTLTASATGAKAVTGVGFQPTLVFHLYGRMTAAGSDANWTDGSIGAMDDAGNQWVIGINSYNGLATSNTDRIQLTTQCINSTFSTDVASYASMDSDGFTINVTTKSADDYLLASLCLRGLRAKVGNFTKPTDAAPVDQAAQNIGFTTTAFFLASNLNTTSASAADHAALALGAASGTTAVEASAWFDEHNVGTSDNYGLDDTALAFEKIDETGAEVATATCGNINMETAGWINWGVNDAVATQICYVAFAALATGGEFIYGVSGQRSWKMAVANNAITMTEEKDFGNNAVMGKPSQFEALWYVPAGGAVLFQELTTVAASGSTDTWTAAGSGLYATAFTTAQDGATAKLLRARPTNLVDLAATAPRTSGSWADDFEVGDTSSQVVETIDTGIAQFVSKTDGLYRWTTPGVASKVPIATTIDSEGGVGLIGVQGMEVCFVSYPSGLWCVNVDSVRAIGPDAIRTNESIPNVSLEPFRGRHYENAMFGRWLWTLYRVTESSSTRTYIMAGYIHQLGSNPIIEWHTPFMESGSARGLGIFEIDDKVTIWTQVGGQFVYRVIGRDGSPNAGRDAIGYGAASTSYNLYLPIDDMELPHTLKHLRCFEAKTRNVNANCPVQLKILRDGGSAENVGSAITSDGVSKRYWTLGSNDTARDVMPLLNITTGSSYSNTTDDPQLWGAVVRCRPRPDRGGIYRIIIDTGAHYSNHAEPTEDAKTQRDNLKALENGSPVACVDADGISITLAIDEVQDLEVREDAVGDLKWTIGLYAEEFVNA